LISATDPVSVLAIFKELDADPNLYSIIFGESIFNDAIGIVMYETVRQLGKDAEKPMSEELGGAIGSFIWIFIGSLLIGAASALCVAFVQKRQAIYMRYDEYA
jgi:NhaP-type Na+/H+ or K+/H+ antiporter